MIGACNRCGCSIEQCECPDRHEDSTKAAHEHSEFMQKLAHHVSYMKDYPGRSGPCFDCHGNVFLYMLTDEIWEKVWPNCEEHRKLMIAAGTAAGIHLDRAARQHLCFGCVEARLGRQLHLSDFSFAPANDCVRFGYRMGARTGR